ncbi:hypothetical protein [Actinoplanes sp. NPDC026619]|uniref:SbtR family transcriptional regulator n=1 Tax=Actinoplanes sp. NPDC026619 TaxID=3155798 RepID=UPI00340B6919
MFGELLDRAHAAGAVDPAVSREDMVPLMCGVMFAASVHPGDRAANARRYLTVLLNGIAERDEG